LSAIESATERLLQARRGGPLPSAPELPDAQAAYAVQAGVARALGWFDAAHRPQHWKSGGPSRQAELTHAALPPAGIWASPARAADWPFTLRGIEAEIALRLSQPVGAAEVAALTPDTAPALIDAMAVAIEVLESRWAQGLQAPAWAKLADLGCHGALVLGPWVAFEPGRDWRTQTLAVQIGPQPEAWFCGSHPLGGPTWGLLPWLRHATRDGAVLPAGSVVTTGNWCGALQAAAGDEVRVHFPGIGSASLQF
jgi:2-keto-4-pentenoate hydratase